MKKPHAEPSAWPGTGLGKALFPSPAPVYTKPLNLPAKRDCVSLRLSVFNGEKKAKSQVASLRAGHICQLPHLALPFSQQKDGWVASLVHQSGRPLAAVALGIGLPPDGLCLLLRNVKQLGRGLFLASGTQLWALTVKSVQPVLPYLSVSQVTHVLTSDDLKS